MLVDSPEKFNITKPKHQLKCMDIPAHHQPLTYMIKKIKLKCSFSQPEKNMQNQQHFNRLTFQ